MARWPSILAESIRTWRQASRPDTPANNLVNDTSGFIRSTQKTLPGWRLMDFEAVKMSFLVSKEPDFPGTGGLQRAIEGFERLVLVLLIQSARKSFPADCTTVEARRLSPNLKHICKVGKVGLQTPCCHTDNYGFRHVYQSVSGKKVNHLRNFIPASMEPGLLYTFYTLATTITTIRRLTICSFGMRASLNTQRE